MLLPVAFLVLGFLVGNLVGLSSAEIVTALVGLLFAFAGGSVIALLRRLTPEDRGLAARALLSLSIGCLAGTYMGIVVSERQLLSPKTLRLTRDSLSASTAALSPDRFKYLRDATIQEANAIDVRYGARDLSCEEAYRELRTAIRHLASGNQ